MIKAIGSMAIPVPNLFTDACFSSIDEKLICCERKKIGDMASCILDGRFLFQMQRCKEAGGDYLVLALEGRYRRSPEDGLLEIPVWGVNRNGNHTEIWKPVQPTTQFSRFDQYLTELQRDVGIIVKHTENVRGTADTILALYQNFQTPPDQHHSLNTIFKAPTPAVQLVRPSLVRRIASELPGIGWERSGAVAQHFNSVTEMVNAGISDWESITTTDGKGKSRRIGRKVAERIVKALSNSIDK
jgi:ERCC4-type nuclease